MDAEQDLGEIRATRNLLRATARGAGSCREQWTLKFWEDTCVSVRMLYTSVSFTRPFNLVLFNVVMEHVIRFLINFN